MRRAHAVHPIAAVQTGYSLWTRNPEIAVLDACKELGVAFVAFSPVARGFLCGKLQDVSTLDANDICRSMPRFAPDNYAANLKLLPAYQQVAGKWLAVRRNLRQGIDYYAPTAQGQAAGGRRQAIAVMLLDFPKEDQAYENPVGDLLDCRGLIRRICLSW